MIERMKQVQLKDSGRDVVEVKVGEDTRATCWKRKETHDRCYN